MAITTFSAMPPRTLVRALVRPYALAATRTVALAVALTACGSAPAQAPAVDAAAENDADTSTTSEVDTASEDAAASETDTATADSTEFNEDFWILYYRMVFKPPYIASQAMLTNWKNPKVSEDNATFASGVSPFDAEKPAVDIGALLAIFDNSYSCKYGCVFSASLDYIAVALGDPTASGYDFKLGRRYSKPADLSFNFAKFNVIQKVTSLQFASDSLYYSTPNGCNATGTCQYAIRRRGPLSSTPATDDVLAKVPPDNDPDLNTDTTYKGHFQVSEDGSTLVFLTTTIRSVKLWALRDGVMKQLDYICEHPLDDGTCIGQGSQYHDNDRVGISKDGKTIALFTIIDNTLQVRRYDSTGSIPKVSSNLLSVAKGKDYLAGACNVLDPEKPQLAEVKGTPQFSADGKTVYFLGYALCPKGSLNKLWTDILSLCVDKIGGLIEDSEWSNYTHNPRDNSPLNKRIFDFTLSPKQLAFVISATASLTTDGKPLDPLDKIISFKDSEIYVLPVGESQWLPVTNEPKFDAYLGQVVAPW